MRIAIIVTEVCNCGPVNLVLNIVKGFNNLNLKEITITLISLRKPSNLNFVTNIENELGVSVIHLDSKDKINILKKFDILHSHSLKADMLVSNLSNTKIISTLHCMLFKDYIDEYGFLKGIMGAFLHSLVLRFGKFSNIICCSDSVKKYSSLFLSSKKILTINNCVDTNFFKRISIQDREERKNNLSLSGKKIFLFCGRFIKRKNVPELIKYFLNLNVENSVLILLGNGPEFDFCKNKFNFSNIIFLGNVDNPIYFYQISDYILSFSKAEGYPMSILEAVACGCYAILSDIEPHNEFLNKNPGVGCIINNSIFVNINFPRNIVVSDQISCETMANHYLSVYRE